MKSVFFYRKNISIYNNSKVFRKSLLISAFIICLLFITLFSGCSGLYIKASKYISEYRSCLFFLKSEDIIATFTSGKREKEFYYDGKNTRLVPYGVLSVKYTSPVDIEKERNFVLLIDSLQYTGKLEYNPIDGTFVADIGKEITENSDIYVRLWGGGVSDQAHMYCVSQDFIDYKEAFKIAVNHMGDSLKKYIHSGKLKGEFFIKFVGERVLDEMSYYVQFVGQDKKSIVVLIDVFSGEIKYTNGLN